MKGYQTVYRVEDVISGERICLNASIERPPETVSAQDPRFVANNPKSHGVYTAFRLIRRTISWYFVRLPAVKVLSCNSFVDAPLGRVTSNQSELMCGSEFLFDSGPR